MLHIMTPLYRFENLDQIYQTIPQELDIRWHIAKSNKREDLCNSWIESDSRILIYNTDCEDQEIYKKRNAVLSQIKEGYFCFIDDDTFFHPGMYKIYKECQKNNFVGMVIGKQIDYANQLRLKPSKPIYCKIDTGNVLAHTDCLAEIQWPSEHQKGVNEKDFLFWEAVHNFFQDCKLTEEIVSVYNKIRPSKR